jgi:hypothetical protein
MEQKDYGNLIEELATSRETDRRQTAEARQQEQAALLARRRAIIQPALDVLMAAKAKYADGPGPKLYVFNTEYGTAHYYGQLPLVSNIDPYAAFCGGVTVSATEDDKIELRNEKDPSVLYASGGADVVVPTLVSLIADMVRRRP